MNKARHQTLNKPPQYSLTQTLVVWFLILATLPMVLVAWISYQQAESSLTQDAKEKLEHIADSKAAFINNWFDYRFRDLSYEANNKNNLNLLIRLEERLRKSGGDLAKYVDSHYWNSESDVTQKDLATLADAYDYIRDLYLIDTNGNILYSVIRESDFGSNLLTGPLSNTRFANSVKTTLKTGQTLFSDLERYVAANNAIAGFLTAPLRNASGDTIGVFAIQLKMQKIFQQLTAFTHEESSQTHYLIGQDGRLRSAIGGRQDDVLERIITTEGFHQWLTEHNGERSAPISQSKNLTYYTGPAGQQVLGTHRSINLTNGVTWALINEINQDETLAKANWLGITILMLTVVTGLLATALAIFKAKQIIHPIVQLSNASMAVAAGRINQQVEIESENEIGQLAKTFNHMLEVRRRHEHTLEENRSQLQLVIESTGSGVWDWQIKSGLVSINKIWADIIGYTQDELESFSVDDWMSLIHPDDLIMSNHLLEEHWRGKAERYSHELRVKHKQGYWVWVLDTGMTVEWNADGEPTRMIGTYVDITKRKQTDENLRIKSQQLNEAQRMAMIGSWSWDYKSDHVEWTDEIFRLFEVDPSQTHASFETYLNVIHPDDRDKVENSFRNAVANHKPYEMTHRIKMADGRIKYVQEYGETHYREDGTPYFSQGTLQDITKLKLTEIALKEQAQHTQAILDNMIDGIITIDQHGIIGSFNPAAERIFGYTSEEVFGQNVNMLMPSPHRENHDRYLHNYHSTGVKQIIGIGREVEGQRKDKSLFPMKLAVSEITHQGQPMYVGTINDISERKRIERMKNEFISTVSHELRTPLTSISGALGLVSGGAFGELPAPIQEMINIAHKNSQRLTHIINDLLDIEKQAAGKMHFDMQVLPLMPLIKQTLEVNQTYGAEHQVTLTLNSDIPEVDVRVDSQRLMQVLSNLLSNAIKYSPEGGTVEVKVCQHDNSIRVTVTDQGPGIPKEFYPRIFQKFAQADSSDIRQKGGTGLGLAITKELLEHMDGLIGFDSVEGAGTSFYFELPLQNSQTAKTAGNSHTLQNQEGSYL